MIYKQYSYFLLALFIRIAMNKSYGNAQSIADRKIEQLH
jgi:hypothetical protein